VVILLLRFSARQWLHCVWYHVAVVKNSAGFSIYVNGVQEDSRSPLPDFLDSNSTNLLIGSNILEGAHLKGLVDEVEIYNRHCRKLRFRPFTMPAVRASARLRNTLSRGQGRFRCNCTVTSNPSGINCGVTAHKVTRRHRGDAQRISRPGSVFEGWSGGGVQELTSALSPCH